MVNDIVNIISTVGFPIACAVGLGIFIYKAYEKMSEMNQLREQKLYDMLDQTQKQLKKATEINASFVEVLSDFRNDITKIQDDIQEIKHEIKTDYKVDDNK